MTMMMMMMMMMMTMNEKIYMAHRNFHTQPRVFTAPDTQVLTQVSTKLHDHVVPTMKQEQRCKQLGGYSKGAV